MRLWVFAAMFALVLWGAPAFAGTALDTDGDGVVDSFDNCSIKPNPAQDDTDGDSCGNLCDADYNQNGNVTVTDFGQFAICYGMLNCAGKQHVEPISNGVIVNVADFGYFASAYGAGPAGPSGTTSGTTACP